MGYVGLLLSGAALFLNSLVILGKAEMKSAGVFNLFVGALQIIIPFYLIMISDQSNWTVYSYAATFLFGLTYLYVGVTFIKGMDSSGLGWFCIWVAIIALFYMVVSFVQFHDVVNALTWFMWALLWYLFFVLNTQKKNINQYLGRIAFVQSWVTLTLPSLFYFMGVWGEGFVYELWIYVSVISILYFCYCIYKYRVR
ncbi:MULTISPECIES: AmiS/UreI family transporter [Bacillus]|uniref:Acetamide transporter n=1 Tax=Bacillus cereus TaxID=1396 RepID=A0AAW4QZQ8_BACCE|nr:MULTISPECIES: AmiS/UreI family transporter [Bacillus]EEK59388.1 Transporter [Bacillus cereus 172560W]MBY0038789.1 acetamide transporter [Bacillus cereus]MDA1936231.1 AmiS/UreI family transporter [Bacillus cereus]MDA1941851.1 AmiS/UreI family transporter [Bacillus cereus]MDZ4585354.1 AmiS/UreI family transporter [Bacillus cereus]